LLRLLRFHALPTMRQRGSLLFLLAFALALRIYQIGWGLPDVYEEATPHQKAWSFWNWGKPGLDLHPRFFNYPALTFYVQFGVQAAHFAAGHIAGAYPTLEQFRASVEHDPTLTIILARIANTLFDVGTVFMVFILTRRCAGDRAAALAAGLLAVVPLHIQLSQMVNVDVPLTFFVMLTIGMLVSLRENCSLRRYLLTGMCIGLAASAKYTGGLLVVPLVVAHILRAPRRVFAREALLRLSASLVASGLVFVLLNPYVVMDFRQFLNDFSSEQYHMRYGHFGIAGDSSTPGFYLGSVLPAAVGVAGMLFALFGLAVTPRTAWPMRYQLALWPLLYIGVVMTWTMHADRYLLPIVPAVVIWASIGLMWVWSKVEAVAQARGIPRAVVGVLLVLVLLWQPLLADMRYYRSALLPDTREIARTWAEKVLPPGSVAVMGPLGLTLKPPLVTFPIPYRSVEFEEFAPFYDARWYEDFEVTVGSNFDLARFQRDPQRYKEFLQMFYDSLQVRWTLLLQIEPVRGQRGPAIWLYAPPRPARALYPSALLDRLTSVRSNGMLRSFMANLVAVHSAKRNHEKVIQLLVWEIPEYVRRGLRPDAARAAAALFVYRPGDGTLKALRDSLTSAAGVPGHGSP